uniref:uncharacterized protein LOC122597990 n=1 Tax=Erigeron canadensis TaxID=72917 RepID=UPI001CB9901F|nr:uncharacterized protein LOC122597990 [Erigeron canadensis]
MSTDGKRIATPSDDKVAAAAVGEEKQFKFEILKVSSAEFKNLTFQQKRYWVHAHFMFKAKCPAVEDAPVLIDLEEEEEEEEEVSKVPKNNDDNGESGPREASWKRMRKPDDWMMMDQGQIFEQSIELF